MKKFPLNFKIVANLVLCLSPLYCLISLAHSEKFELPTSSDSVIGTLQTVNSRGKDTLVDIAREFDLGYDQIVKANPKVNRWIPGEGTKVLLPQFYVLPGALRRGIVLNIAELRLYYYPPASKKSGSQIDTVYTFPVSIGRMDWKTPLGSTKVIAKDRNPAWRPPKSIREEHALEGEILPDFIPGGAADNPLGLFALRLGFPGYLIHGVDERKTYGIGMRVTHGCIRMYPDDIELLFDLVSINTPVFIMNESIKLGRIGNKLFLEVHQPLEEDEDPSAPLAPRVTLSEVLNFLSERIESDLEIDEKQVQTIVENGDGIPSEIAVLNTYLDDLPDFKAQQELPSKRSLDSEYEKAISEYGSKRDN